MDVKGFLKQIRDAYDQYYEIAEMKTGYIETNTSTVDSRNNFSKIELSFYDRNGYLYGQKLELGDAFDINLIKQIFNDME